MGPREKAAFLKLAEAARNYSEGYEVFLAVAETHIGDKDASEAMAELRTKAITLRTAAVHYTTETQKEAGGIGTSPRTRRR